MAVALLRLPARSPKVRGNIWFGHMEHASTLITDQASACCGAHPRESVLRGLRLVAESESKGTLIAPMKDGEISNPQ